MKMDNTDSSIFYLFISNEEKHFHNMDRVIFSSLPKLVTNKLECLFHFQPSILFVSKAGACTREAPFRHSLLRQNPHLNHKY
jgi:hypothetical protein